MRFLPDLEPARFNDFVERHPLGTIQQCAEWGAVKAYLGATAHRVGVEAGGRLRGAALLLCIPFRKHERCFVWAPRGPLLDFGDREALDCFAAGVRRLAEARDAVFVRVDPPMRHRALTIDGEVREGGEDNRWLPGTMHEAGFAHVGFESDRHGIQPRYVMWLHLDRGPEALFEGFHPKTRYNIRLARKRGVEIVAGGRDDLPRFEAIMRITGERDGFRTKSLEYFQGLHDALAPAGRLELFLARYDARRGAALLECEIERERRALVRAGATGGPAGAGRSHAARRRRAEASRRRIDRLGERLERCRRQAASAEPVLVVAGAIAVYSGDHAAYLYGASDNVYRDLMPNHLLQWEMIRRACSRGARLYDLRGSGRPGTGSMQGLYAFKRGFGAEFVELIGEFDMVLDRGAYDLLLTRSNELGKKQKKLFKELRG